MGDFLHRDTKVYLQSVPPSALPEPLANYVAQPDLSAVSGFDRKYWILTGDVITLMDVAARAVVDAAEATASTLERRTISTAIPDDVTYSGVKVRELIELFNKRDNYLVNRLAELQDAMAAMKASVGPADNIRAAIPASFLATATRTKADAVQDYKDDIATGAQDV